MLGVDYMKKKIILDKKKQKELEIKMAVSLLHNLNLKGLINSETYAGIVNDSNKMIAKL